MLRPKGDHRGTIIVVVGIIGSREIRAYLIIKVSLKLLLLLEIAVHVAHIAASEKNVVVAAVGLLLLLLLLLNCRQIKRRRPLMFEIERRVPVLLRVNGRLMLTGGLLLLLLLLKLALGALRLLLLLVLLSSPVVSRSESIILCIVVLSGQVDVSPAGVAGVVIAVGELLLVLLRVVARRPVTQVDAVLHAQIQSDLCRPIAGRGSGRRRCRRHLPPIGGRSQPLAEVQALLRHGA